MLGFLAKMFRSRREKPISKIIAGEIKRLPKGSLSTDEKDQIQRSLTEIHDSTIELVAGFESSIEIILERIWHPEKATERQRILREEVEEEERQRIAEEKACYVKYGKAPFSSEGFNQATEPSTTHWYIAFTPDFTKSLKRVDRKLQGRILSAITHLTESPLKPVGDTVEPLSAKLSGLWRYRIGDHRLIYRPDESSKRIYLLSFGPRGSVYNA